jgi:glycerol-3-phosphate acyltransferase PlsY
MATLLAIILLAYLIGSFPTGIVFGVLFKGIDVRQHGSKGMGATNVFRVLGAKLAVPVLLIDILKGIAATLLISQINFGDLAMSAYWLKIIAGFAAIFGHIFPVWVGFKGGKGVGTAAGVFLGLMPLETGFALLFFTIVVALTRYVSLGSILASLFLVTALIAQRLYLELDIPNAYLVLAVLLFLTVLLTHRHNIKRIIRGEENKLGEKVKN